MQSNLTCSKHRLNHIQVLHDGIRALDKEIKEATETRREEQDVCAATSAANAVAVASLKFAKDRMHQFDNPSPYTASPKRRLSSHDDISLTIPPSFKHVAPPKRELAAHDDISLNISPDFKLEA